MNKLFKTLSFLAVIVLITTLFVQSQQVSASPDNLPYGLTLQDTMASVEQKLGQPRVEFAPQAGWEPGLPDEGSSPDHIHYWAKYERFGLTVVYNSPSATDKNATIKTVLINK
jgi:hypothetical protein